LARAGTSCFKISKDEFEIVIGLSGDMLEARQQKYATSVIERNWIRCVQRRADGLVELEEGVPPDSAGAPAERETVAVEADEEEEEEEEEEENLVEEPPPCRLGAAGVSSGSSKRLASPGRPSATSASAAY
jgi:hypothetical protein